MKVKEESEKAGFKLSFQQTKIMPSDPIISWQIDGETMEIVTDFTFLGSKITVNGDCSHEIRGCLLLGRKAMTNLDSILKNRHVTLLTKAHIVKAMVFPVVMYGCESWTIRSLSAKQLMPLNSGVGEELLRISWTETRSNQSILNKINPEYSLEELMLKLKLQYFGHLM